MEMKAYIYNDEKGEDISVVDIPEDMQDDAELYRTELVEKICDLDDDLMMEYLEGNEPSVDDLKKALRKATCECTAVPVCCGTAYRNKGVQKLLDAVVEYMPAPTDIPAITGTDEDGNEVERHSSDEEPFSALAFKIMTDPFVGKLAYFRVYSGSICSFYDQLFLKKCHLYLLTLQIHTMAYYQDIISQSSALGKCQSRAIRSLNTQNKP